MTVGTGKSALALVAVFALLLSAFASTAQPTAATHDGGFDHQPLPIDTSTFAHDTGECDDVDLDEGEVLLHFIANQQNVAEPITLNLSFQGGGSAVVDSTKWNEPGQINNNVTHHFYLMTDGDVTITDLDISTGEGNVRLSHVCRGEDDQGVEDDAGIVIEKVDEQDEPLSGAIFTVEGATGEFTTGPDGRVCVDGLPQDATLTVTEIQPPAGYLIADSASQEVEVDEDGCDSSPDVTFVNELDDQGVEAVTVSIMKHLCDEVSSIEEFEAIELAAAAADPDNALAPLVATVVACPTIVLTGDVPTSGAVSGGEIDFDFSVVDAAGMQMLSTDGMFNQAALCEDDVNVDVDGSGTVDADVCLDTSHYLFEVQDGTVVITETDPPEGSTGFGTLRFTPGSEDETALTTSIGAVEASGVITLDTSSASEIALADGMIMLHVYNFAAPEDNGEGEQPSGEGTAPSQGGPGQGTLPDTATSTVPSGSVPAALLALAMLTGLCIASYTTAAEARRRR